MNKTAVVLFLAALWAHPHTVCAEEISAGSALVMKSDNQEVLYEKKSQARMLPASTTKLIMAIIAIERLAPDTVVTVSKNAAGTPSVMPTLKKGDRFTVKDLLYLALMRSVNGAAVGLAEAVAGSEDAFVKIMNERVATLGLKDTHFVNASGLPGKGQYITAFDLAVIMKVALKMPLIEEIMNTRVKEIVSIGGRRLFLKNTNLMLWSEDDTIIGKTGYTRAAKNCFVCAAQKGGKRIIVVVLGVSKREEMWKETATLLSRRSPIAYENVDHGIYLSQRNMR
jgi:D-alanyl-D-alanine carboxypeptidase (penicillin-binding protein 5/6)